jgi:hypothetical protein
MRTRQVTFGRELPAGIADFTGRAATVAAICSFHRAAGTGPAPAMSVITGAGGAGKTALAVHVARALGDRYPDGQIFVDLHGLSARPASPARVLGWLLRAMDGPRADLPDDLDRRAALFRSRLAGRRVLLVLDDAAAEAQVRPLLPGERRCGVIVTSRRSLGALDGAQTHDIGEFTQAEARALLEALAGPARVEAETAAADRIVDLCGRLPLAIRIAGARLAARPGWPLARFADLLAPADQRLDLLRIGDRDVRASIARSVRTLDTDARRLFGLLGRISADEFPAWAAAALLPGQPDGRVSQLLEHLVDVRLLARPQDGEPAGYTMPALIRLYSQEVATQAAVTRFPRDLAESRLRGAAGGEHLP